LASRSKLNPFAACYHTPRRIALQRKTMMTTAIKDHLSVVNQLGMML
jgi:hypothetical protein